MQHSGAALTSLLCWKGQDDRKVEGVMQNICNMVEKDMLAINDWAKVSTFLREQPETPPFKSAANTFPVLKAELH